MDISLETIEKAAIILREENYRYSLSRLIDKENSRVVTFVMLNPSEADEKDDDPTIRRCIGYAEAWGFGKLQVVNLFATISPDPSVLLNDRSRDIAGPENEYHIKNTLAMSELTICAWGNGNLVRKLLRESQYDPFKLLHGSAYCIKLSKYGHPMHPLYLRK